MGGSLKGGRILPKMDPEHAIIWEAPPSWSRERRRFWKRPLEVAVDQALWPGDSIIPARAAWGGQTPAGSL